MIIDLVESSLWLDGNPRWPGWLDHDWLIQNNARFICRLTHPSHINALRNLIPDSSRLLAYPHYPHLEQELSETELAQVQHAFMRCLGAEQYFTLLPDTANSGGPEMTIIPRISRKYSAGIKKLALVTPMPPVASGIASYCSEILPELSRYYDITLVLEDAGRIDSDLSNQFDVIDYACLMETGAKFDRIMYHFGNSGLHYDYFTLLQAHPGLVVLHDIYLGDCIYANFEQLGLSGMRQQVYASHGWSALTDCEAPIEFIIELYPACASVFLDSLGVVVHNNFAGDRLSLFFGEDTLSNLHRTSHARKIKVLPDRIGSRQQLNIPADARVYTSFGMLVPNKCLDQMIEAWARSELGNDPRALLCLVGGCTDHVLEKELQQCIENLPRPEQVILTGFLDSSTYEAYLGVTDVAIQLRRNSRGESSGALLDCMAAGIPTIVNAHGSSAEMPEETVIMVGDDFNIDELVRAFQLTLDQPEQIQDIGRAARLYVKENLSLEKIVAEYRDIIEFCYQDTLKTLPGNLQCELFRPKLKQGRSVLSLNAAIRELDDLMSCTTQHTPTLAGTQLLVDISRMANGTASEKSGKTCADFLKNLLHAFCLGYRVEPIYYDPKSEHFRYGRTYVSHFLELSPVFLSDDPVECRPGDIYLGLDTDFTIEAPLNWIQTWRGRGVKTLQLLIEYSLAAVSNEQNGARNSIQERLTSITETADGVIMPNRSEADKYATWLDEQSLAPTQQPGIAYLQGDKYKWKGPAIDKSLPYSSVLPIRWVRKSKH